MLLIGGIDEAGRGPVLGPLVVAGVASSEDDPFEDLALRDSKLMTPRAREKMAAIIRDRADAIETVVASADEIDAWRTTMTLNEVEVRLFGRIGRALRADTLIVDACDVDARRFGIAVEVQLNHRCKVLSAHGADRDNPVVSAASIIAKTERDRLMADISRRMEQRFGVPTGSGYPSDPQTRRFLEVVFDTTGALPDCVRHSWKTVSALLADRGVRPEPGLATFDEELAPS